MKQNLLFSPTWWKTTLVVIVAVMVMVRLGIWQLDRLQQRREFNNRVQAQINQPVIDLNTALQHDDMDRELIGMEYRDVKVTGEYDPSGEVVLRNQVWESLLGIHLLTPLKIVGTDQKVLVNRGWVPFEDFTNHDLGKYNEPGLVEVHGVIRLPQTKPEVGGHRDEIPASGEGKLLAWNFVNVQGIESQLPYHLLPIYIQASPEPSWTTLPYRNEVELDLTEGPHMGYAIQWFIFAAILGFGYPFYLRKEGAQSQAGKRTLSPALQSDEIKTDTLGSTPKGNAR